MIPKENLRNGDRDLLRTWNQRLGVALSKRPELENVRYSLGEDTRQIVLEIQNEQTESHTPSLF